jgi:hypothetical protein
VHCLKYHGFEHQHVIEGGTPALVCSREPADAAPQRPTAIMISHRSRSREGQVVDGPDQLWVADISVPQEAA